MMNLNKFKYITLFFWSPMISPLYFWLMMRVQHWIPKSNIDGSTVIGNLILSSMQMSSLVVASFFIVDVILQVILLVVYKKWGAFTGKNKVAKAIIGAIVSYVLFLIVAMVSLGISYSYTMSKFI